MNIYKAQLIQSYSSIGEQAAKVAQLQAAADAIGLADVLEDIDGYIYFSAYAEPMRIEVNLYSSHGLTQTFELTESNPLQVVARRLLPKAGKLTKGFDETANKLTLSVLSDGIAVVFSMSTPAACTVEAVTEEVEVEEKVIPAHTEKKTRYVLKGDCEPLMKTSEVAEPVAVTAEVADDIPF